MDAQAKQQVADRIKQATNILVTVNTNPTVDQLAACIGLTLFLNKIDKHATAVFSGKVPSTIEFLQPEKTIERNTDSLQDFIISLDKAKADKLRYKVEDEFVRIFITPYKTSISPKDLQFSQGDFNVEVVMALGVTDQKQLDAAITAHGRILHDATVISVNAGAGKSPALGQINWRDSAASSLSEMLVSISESFGSNLLDGQMATAFLTGIVSETERFSNAKTSPKVMTMSAQLMAAGANQQLIASKLEPPEAPPATTGPASEPPKGQPPTPAAPSKDAPRQKSADGSLDISHKDGAQTSDEVSVSPNEIQIDNEGNLKRLAEIASQKEAEAEEAKKQVEEALASAAPAVDINTVGQEPQKPQGSMPGSHSLLPPLDASETPFTANTQPEWQTTAYQGNDADGEEHKEVEGLIGHAPDVTPPVSRPFNFETIEQNPPGAHVDQARNAVENALSAAPFNPELSPVQSLNAVPITDSLHSGVDSQLAPDSADMSPAAPPSVPPPLTMAQGVVIPSPYMPARKNGGDNPNNNS